MLCLILFCCNGCSATKQAIKNVSDMSYNASITLTNHVQPSLLLFNNLITNNVIPTLNNLKTLEEMSIVTFSNLNAKAEKLDSNSTSILISVNQTLSTINTNLPMTFTNINNVGQSLQSALTNLSSVIRHADEVILDLKESQENIKNHVDKFEFKIQAWIIGIAIILSTYAFRRNNIIDDMKWIYKKIHAIFIKIN